MSVNLGGTTGEAQQQQGSASRASTTGRCHLHIPFLNICNYENLFISWIVYILM
jgi:hypothetical protein